MENADAEMNSQTESLTPVMADDAATIIDTDTKEPVVAAEPIAPDDTRFGTTPREKAKQVGAYFREQFAQLRQRLEGVDYLKQKLRLNYLYKDIEVARAVKADYTAHAAQYYQLSRSLPAKARLLHIADDYGQLDFLLLLTYPEREIVSVIEDDEKRAVAQQSYLLHIRKLQYLKARPDESFDIDIIGNEVVRKRV